REIVANGKHPRELTNFTLRDRFGREVQSRATFKSRHRQRADAFFPSRPRRDCSLHGAAQVHGVKRFEEKLDDALSDTLVEILVDRITRDQDNGDRTRKTFTHELHQFEALAVGEIDIDDSY